MLKLIEQDTIAADIARQLKIKKSHVSYYISRAKNRGLVKQETRDTYAVLQLTQAGKNFLDQYTRNNPTIPICRLENVQFKAKVLQMPTIAIDWKRVEMRNWVQYTSKIDEVYVRLNQGAVPSLVLLPSPVDGDDPFQCYTVQVAACVNVLLDLHDKMGLKVGVLELGSKGEWLVYDPVAKSFCKNVGQVTYDGVGKVNASPPRHFGELEFHDPRSLLDYLSMPKLLARIVDIVEKQDLRLDSLEKQLARIEDMLAKVPNQGKQEDNI